MKKLIALMLSVMMLFSTVSLVSAESVLEPVSIYAGARTITAEYGTDELSEELIGDIALATYEGTPVEFTKQINGKFLTIIPSTEFTRDTQDYVVTIGNTKKVFTIKTLFTPKFAVDTERNSVSGLNIAKGNGVVIDVIDENTIIAGVNEGTITPDFDDITNYENASLVADVYFTGDSDSKSNVAFAYNLSSKTPSYCYTYKGSASVSRAAWLLQPQSNYYHKRLVGISNGTSLVADFGYLDIINPLNVVDASVLKRSIKVNSYGSTFTSGAITVGTTTLPEGFAEDAVKYRYVIDKMSTVGTLMMNDTLIDVMDTREYYDQYNTANDASLVAPTTGYLAVAPVASNFRIVISNMALITSEMRDYASGTLTASATTDGEKIIITFDGADDLDISKANVEDFISASDNLSYEISAKEGNKVELTVFNPVFNKDYTITINEGLGYEDITVKSQQNLTVSFKQLVATSVYAGQQSIIVRLSESTEATELTEEQKNLTSITRIDTGAELEFTTKISDDILTIMPAESFVINEADAENPVSYLFKFGNTKKVFSVNKIWEDGLDSGSTANLKILPTSGGPVVDGKKLVLATSKAAVYPQNVDYTSKENLSFSFKLQPLANGMDYAFMFNHNHPNNELRNDLHNTSWVHSTHFGWWTYAQNYYSNINSNRRGISIKTDSASVMQNVGISWNNDYRDNFQLDRPTESKYSAESGIDAAYGDTMSATITIDKMGTVAAFVQDGVLKGEAEPSKNIVDIWDTADAYLESGNETIAAAEPVKTGAFVIANRNPDLPVAVYDMVITETAIRDYASGNLTATAVADGDYINLVFNGAEDIDLSSVNAEEYISISDDLEYSIASQEGNIISLAAVNPVYGKEYTITVAPGLGYEDLSVKTLQTMTAQFEQFVPGEIYAGQETITVKLLEDEGDELSAGKAATIKIIRNDTNEEIDFTTKVTGDTLTIFPEKGFEINEINTADEDKITYFLKIGSVNKVFAINKFWEDSFDTATNADEMGLIYGSGDSKPEAISDGKFIYDTTVKGRSGSGTGIYPDESTYYNKENVSFSVKIQFLNKFPSYAIIFNADRNYGYPYYAGKQSFNGFGFHTYFGQSGSLWYNYYIHANKPVYNYYNGDSVIKTTFTPAYSSDYVQIKRPLVELSETVGTTPSKSKWTDSNYIPTDEMKDKNIFTITVDKMGSVASYVQEGKVSPELENTEENNYDAYKAKINGIEATRDLVHVYDTAEVYAADSTLKDLEVPTTGRFGISLQGSNAVIAFYDMILTETEMRDYEVGTFNATGIEANNKELTVTFDKNVSQADISKVVLSRADGNTVNYTKNIDENELTIIPEGGFTLDRVYNITIAEDFGYDAMTLSAEYSKDFRIKKLLSTNEDGFGAFSAKYNVSSNPVTDYMVEKDGVLYINDLDYNTVYLRGIVDNIENYNITFDAKFYATPAFNIFFNGSGNNTILNYGDDSLITLGWYQSGSVLKRDLRHEKRDSSSVSTGFAVNADNQIFIAPATADVVFENGSVTVPETTATTYSYKIDKKGTKGDLYIDGTLADSFETKDEFARWNTYAAENGLTATESTPAATGFLVFAPSCSWKTDSANNEDAKQGTLALSNVVISTFELVEEGVEITNVTYLDANGNTLESIQSAPAVKGTVNVKNYFSIEKNIKLIAIAYAGDMMLDVKILEPESVDANGKATADYSFTDLVGLTEIKVVVWESFSTLYPYCAAYTKNN